MFRVKTFNLIKNAAWSCVLNTELDSVEKEDQRINLVLLHDIMHEIKVFIEFYKLKSIHQKRASARRSNLLNPDTSFTKDEAEDEFCKHMLKRFSVIGPTTLKHTIQRCENLGLLLN